MNNKIQILPMEMWNEIIDFCPDLSSIRCLTVSNKEISKIALIKLNKIKININELCTEFYKIQALYTEKYQNMYGPTVNVATLGKCILFEFAIEKNGLVKCGSFIDIGNDVSNLEYNQLIIAPVFGEEELSRYLPEDNPNYPLFGFGLNSRANSIAQDRLPIKKITVNSEIVNPYILGIVNLAVVSVNKKFDKLNGSFVNSFTNWFSSKK